MKLSEIKTTKHLLAYITEFVTNKKSNLEIIKAIVLYQEAINYLKDAIADNNIKKVTYGLTRLSKMDGGPNKIKELYTLVKDEEVGKRFVKYL